MSDVAAGSSPATGTVSADSSSASSASSSTPASSSAAPASSAPASSPAAPVTPVPEQSIPYARFKEVNDQLRAAREFQEKHGWVDQFHSDPYPFLDQWLDQAASHAEMGPKLLAKAARMLQARRGQSVPQTMEEPQPDTPVYDPQGRPTGSFVYSAKTHALREQWLKQQWEASLTERLGPIEEATREYKSEKQRAQIEQQSTQHAQTTLSELRQQPHFKEHEPAIKQALIDHHEWGADVHRAYAHVLTTDVIPNLSRTEGAKVLDHLQTQANGASVHPNGSTASGPPKFKNFGEAIRYFEAHPEEAEASLAKR